MTEQQSSRKIHGQADDPLDTVFTLPNLITLFRFLLIPLFVIFLLGDFPPAYAFAIFVLAASTDWIDGRVARRTNSVSKFGKLFDPLIDRLLLLSGVLGVFLLGRLPLWIVIVLILRDAFLFFGASYIKIHAGGATIPVFFLGKCTTAALLTGFASLLINWPLFPVWDCSRIRSCPVSGGASCLSAPGSYISVSYCPYRPRSSIPYAAHAYSTSTGEWSPRGR